MRCAVKILQMLFLVFFEKRHILTLKPLTNRCKSMERHSGKRLTLRRTSPASDTLAACGVTSKSRSHLVQLRISFYWLGGKVLVRRETDSKLYLLSSCSLIKERRKTKLLDNSLSATNRYIQMYGSRYPGICQPALAANSQYVIQQMRVKVITCGSF